MYTYKRFKTSKSMMRTSLFLMAAAFVAGMMWIGCGDEGDLLGPGSDPSSAEALVALAPGGIPGPPDGEDGGSGGTYLATFMVTIAGDVNGSEETTDEVKGGTKWINVPGGKKMPLTLDFFRDGGNGVWQPPDWTPEVLAKCFSPNVEGSEITEGLLMVVKEKGVRHPSGALFWFPGFGTDGREVTYLLVMSGTFPDEEPWPPTLESGSITIPLHSWEMTAEGNKNKTACTGNSNFLKPTSVTVTRMPE